MTLGSESRRTVTVVFTDVTGSTGLGENLDPEAVRQVMSATSRRCREVLERHGGTVEKFIGDAVMAVFGVPRLHEDDALRAVRAAVEMRRALAALNDELRAHMGRAAAHPHRRQHRRGGGRRPGRRPRAGHRRRRQRRRPARAAGRHRRDPDRRRHPPADRRRRRRGAGGAAGGARQARPGDRLAAAGRARIAGLPAQAGHAPGRPPATSWRSSAMPTRGRSASARARCSR